MSLPEQEALALDKAHRFLLELSSGEYKVESIKKLRGDARDIAKHYPLAARERWLDSNPPLTYTDTNSTK